MDLEKSNFLLVAGKPAAGKSHAIRYILHLLHPDYNPDPVRFIIVFTTTKFNGAYAFLPQEYIHTKYDPEVLSSLIKIQQDTGAKYRAAVIFDDLLSTKAFSSDLFTQLATTFRHLRIDIIISTQYLYRVPPVTRECATRVLIFRQVTKRSLDALYESFGQFFKNAKEFSDYLLKNTGNYQFVLFKSNSSDEDVRKIYRIMKCPAEVPMFTYVY
jgi:energy-coupling factor transporter ATP-binding protein EcfA2